MASEHTRLTKREAIRRRVKGGKLLLAGKSPREVAAEVRVSRQTVYAWKACLAEHGNDLEALQQLDQGGPRARLSAAQKLELESLIEGRSDDVVPAGGWTLKHVSRLIERRFGQSYSLSQVWRLLDDMDYTTQGATAAARVHRRLRAKGAAPATILRTPETPSHAGTAASPRDNANKPDPPIDGER